MLKDSLSSEAIESAVRVTKQANVTFYILGKYAIRRNGTRAESCLIEMSVSLVKIIASLEKSIFENLEKED